MATRFVRIDLSDASRDFRPVAVEPGLPLLDRAGANNRIVFRWLGGLAAEPEWDGESVNFYVRDDHGGRIEDVVCQPVGREDLHGPLKQDVDLLRERLGKAMPESSTERALLRQLTNAVESLVEDPNRQDQDNFFFRYRDVGGRWRLVWCWGYQRADQEPAMSVICTDTDCGLLFVRRPGQSPKCPSCEALLLAGKKKRPRGKRTVLIGLLLFLLGAALVYWWLNPDRLEATPEQWAGPAGSRVDFEVARRWLWRGEDVSRRAVAVPSDPRIVRFDPFSNTAQAVSPGRTAVTFYLGSLSVTTTMEVGPPGNPSSLRIEPAEVELGVGTTARLKLIGEYEDGSTADLTDAAEWLPQHEGVLFAMDGRLEGLAEGRSTVTARYRAGPESEAMSTSAEVIVEQFTAKAMEIGIAPDPVSTGRASDLSIEVVSEADKRYSVLESSRLKLRVDPPHVATAYGTQLRGLHPGAGSLAATFDDKIGADKGFYVQRGAGVETLVVAPKQLDMVVGEIADLAIASPSTEPVRLSSSDADVVEIGRGNRLIGRSEGSAKVQVRQAGQTRSVEVTVSRAAVQAIAIRPRRVVVPVDHAAPVRVMGRLEDGRQVELAPDVTEVEKAPSPRYAVLDRQTLKLRGYEPTSPSDPQRLALRYEAHEAEAPVEVVVAPLRFELTPAGKVDVPLGQLVRLDGWAHYGDGLRVEVFPDRIRWKTDPAAGKVPGLELRQGRVAALESGSSSLTVWGSYFGRESNRVALRAVEAETVELSIEVDRTLRLAGEPGVALLTGTGPRGDVELVPELAAFSSSDAETLGIDAVSGEYQALKPGGVSLSASHPAAEKPAGRDLTVIDPEAATLAFDPASLDLAVEETAPLRLFLQHRKGDEAQRALLLGPSVQYRVGRPDAVSVRPPWVRGLKACEGLGISAAMQPWLPATATAEVAVAETAEPEDLRVVPAQIELAPGQGLALRVEERLRDGESWREVQPETLAWKVPAALLWTPSRDGLRPAVGVPPGTSGELAVQATVRGKTATCAITAAEQGPDAKGRKLVIQREPEGWYVPVGGSQRYAVQLDGEGGEHASEVRWQGDFENDFARWEAPVLTAKRPGHVQWLEADVAGRRVRWFAIAYEPGRYQEPIPSGDRPVAVRILSDQGPSVRFPVGAEFDDFRVEAEYSDGFTRLVTNKATLRTPEKADEAFLAPRDGRLVGLRPGQTTVEAEFEGVSSKPGLNVQVLAGVDVDEIRLKPSPLAMMPGETIPLDAVGYKGGRSVGIITHLGGLTWTSSDEAVARLSGPAVTARSVGRAAVTAQRGALTSLPAEIRVGMSVGDQLAAEPRRTRIRVGESLRMGTDVIVTRGPTDLSRQVTVYPALKDVVRYDAATQSLVGIAPGTTPVSFIWGKKLTDMFVEVVPGGPIAGQVVIEPPSAILAAGQCLRPRVFVVSEDGSRFDQTEAATLTSSAPEVAPVRGLRATGRPDYVFARSAGSSQITATVPGASQPGVASVTVTNEPITGVFLEPPVLNMAVGDRTRLKVLGRAASGTYELYPQERLRLSAAGPNPDAIRVDDPHDVVAVSPGQAEVAATYGTALSGRTLVNVASSTVTDLRIEPATASVRPGQGLVYQVTGLVGARRRVLGPEEGVQLTVREPRVAQVMGRMTVGGNQPGRTGIVASLGAQQAEAVLDVVGGVAAVPGGVVGVGPGRVIDRYADGTVWIDGRRFRYRPGRGWVVVDSGRVVGPGVVDVAPAAGVAALRFAPDTLRIPVGSDGAGVRVMEVRADGTLGRDVTSEPGLELTQPPDVAQVELTPDGPRVRPLGTGETRIGARLGTLVAEKPLQVTVTGDRFLDVQTEPDWGETDFSVTIRVTSAASEGPLEYRVYGEGSPAPETWTAAGGEGSTRQVVLESPRLPYRGEGAQYNLVLEARDTGAGIVQRYPFTFRLIRDIQRTDKP